MEVDTSCINQVNLVTDPIDNFIGSTFADITLVTDDQVQTRAHKCVLAGCSPRLRQLELKAVLQLMYFEYNVEIGKDTEDKVGEVINEVVEKYDSECIYTFNMPVHYEKVVYGSDAVSINLDERMMQLPTMDLISKTKATGNVGKDVNVTEQVIK